MNETALNIFAVVIVLVALGIALFYNPQKKNH